MIGGIPWTPRGNCGTPGPWRQKAAALGGLEVSVLWYSRDPSSIQSLSCVPSLAPILSSFVPSPRLDLASRSTMVPATLASHSLGFISPNLLSFPEEPFTTYAVSFPSDILSNAATALSSTVV